MVQMKSTTFSTVGAAFRSFCHTLDTDPDALTNAASLARTAVLKWTVPGLGGPSPAGQRMNKAEQETALVFLDGVSIEQLRDLEKAQQNTFEALDIAPKIQKTNRYWLSQFLAWVHEQQLTQSLAISEVEAQQHPVHKTRVQAKAPYILRQDQVPAPLRSDIKAFKLHCEQTLDIESGTYDDRIDHILRLFGWCHNIEGEATEGLSFSRLIPFAPITPHEPHLSVTQRYMEQHRLDEAGADAAKAVAELLDRYFDFHANSLATQVLITESLILVAKFVYREEIQRLSLAHFEELNRIPVIRRLRHILDDRQAAHDAAPPVIDHESRSIPWEMTVQVLNQLREKFDSALGKYERSRRTIGPRKGEPKRSVGAVARDLQTFLIVGFFVVLPPDRNRTVRELELGRTLKLGRIQDGMFTPADQLPPQVSPKWYIHLNKKDYKTGKYYGVVWMEVPDILLKNGRSFYHYLNLWVKEYRSLFQPQHNVLFVKTKAIHGGIVGNPQSRSNLTQRIRNAFKAQVGVPVVPQALRKMFTTYVKSSGAEASVIEGSQVAMKHSRRMQERVYDQQPHPEKIQPILDFNMQLFELIFVAEDLPLPLMEDGMIDFPQLTDEQRSLLLKGLEREARRRKHTMAS